MSKLSARLATLHADIAALAAETTGRGELSRFSRYQGRELDFIAEQLLDTRGQSKRYWAGQRAIVARLIEKHRVAVRSSNKGGKTEVLADIVLAFAQTGPTICVSTASGARQVEKGLWSRVNSQFLRAREPLVGECLTMQLKVAPEWYAIGFSTNDKTSFQGFHAGVEVPDDPDAVATEAQADAAAVEAIERASHEVGKRSSTKRLLLVFDEAAGIDQMIFDAAKGSMLGDHVYVLMAGNPTREADEPHEFCRAHRPGSHYWRIKIAALDAPDELECDEAFVAPAWLAKASELEREFPEGTPDHRPRVLGQFYSGDASGRVIPYAFLRGADEATDVECVKRGPHVGFDTAAYGGDANVAALYVDSVKVSEDAWHSPDTVATWDRMKLLREHWQSQLGMAIPWSHVHIDRAPVAAGVIDIARSQGCELHPVDFGGEATYYWREVIGETKFKNRRAELYWSLRELLRRKLARIPRKYERSWQELAAHSYKIDGGGAVLIEPKEDVRKRLGRSPDHADADVLAFSNAPVVSFRRTNRMPR